MGDADDRSSDDAAHAERGAAEEHSNDGLRSMAESTASGSLDRSTARGAQRIFLRFALVAVVLGALLGVAVAAFDIVDSVQLTHQYLEDAASDALGVCQRLRRSRRGQPLSRVVRHASYLTGVPMAIVERGELIFATDPKIKRAARLVYAGASLSPGFTVRIDEQLGVLSGAWALAPLEGHKQLLVIIRRSPGDEGISQYLTISAGVLGLGLCLSLLFMMLMANWMVHRPLQRLVRKLTGALELDIERRRAAEGRAVAARMEAERLLALLRDNQLRLIQSEKMASLGEMATGVAHELNQPLNNIGLVASRMERRLSGLGQPQRDFFRDKLGRVGEQVQRAGKIIDQLRVLGYRPGGDIKAVKISSAVEQVVEMMADDLSAAGITLAIELPADLPAVLADQRPLEQVLINLLRNAHDALVEHPPISSPPEVSISGRLATDGQVQRVELTVSDNGPGMAPDVQARIFEPFFTTKEVGKGTGLGLSISYSLVRGFGGTLAVRSEPSLGTSFTISLELADEQAGRSRDG